MGYRKGLVSRPILICLLLTLLMAVGIFLVQPIDALAEEVESAQLVTADVTEEVEKEECVDTEGIAAPSVVDEEGAEEVDYTAAAPEEIDTLEVVSEEVDSVDESSVTEEAALDQADFEEDAEEEVIDETPEDESAEMLEASEETVQVFEEQIDEDEATEEDKAVLADEPLEIQTLTSAVEEEKDTESNEVDSDVHDAEAIADETAEEMVLEEEEIDEAELEDRPLMLGMALMSAPQPQWKIVKQGNDYKAVSLRPGVPDPKNQWIEIDGKRYFPNQDGILYRNQFITFGSKIAYYMGKDGSTQRGVIEHAKSLYLLDSKTERMRKDNAWVKHNNKHYFPNAQGVLYRNQFITFGPKIAYYMGNDGSSQTGVVNVNGNLHLLDSKTRQLKKDNAWVKHNNKHYFPNAQGVLYRNQFITFGPKISYYMGDDGSSKTGVINVKGNLHLMDTKTRQLRKDNAWVTHNNKKYFPNAQGVLYRNQFITFGRDAYYMGNDGTPQKGIIRTNGEYYFMDPQTSLMRRDNKMVEYKNKYYFPQSSGVLARDKWVSTSPGVSYYMKKDCTAQIAPKERLVIDISRWQDPRKMDFDLLAKQISGAILRVGFTGTKTGESYTKDFQFERFYREFRSRNIPVGAYWYSCANTVEKGEAEATKAIQYLAGKKLQYPLFWDTEDPKHQANVDKKVLTDTGVAFTETVRKAGYKPGIYASSSWFRNKLDMNQLKDNAIWVAHWDTDKPSYATNTYDFWQFTSEGRLLGYDGDLDLNFRRN